MLSTLWFPSLNYQDSIIPCLWLLSLQGFFLSLGGEEAIWWRRETWDPARVVIILSSHLSSHSIHLTSVTRRNGVGSEGNDHRETTHDTHSVSFRSCLRLVHSVHSSRGAVWTERMRDEWATDRARNETRSERQGKYDRNSIHSTYHTRRSPFPRAEWSEVSGGNGGPSLRAGLRRVWIIRRENNWPKCDNNNPNPSFLIAFWSYLSTSYKISINIRLNYK